MYDRRQHYHDNMGYAPMDTSNAIRQQHHTQPRLVDNRQDKPSKGNCFTCGMQGHYARECNAKQPKQQQHNNAIMQESNMIQDDTVLIINEASSGDKLITFDGLVDMYPARILIDCGATTSYISQSFIEKHKVYTEPINTPINAVIANGDTVSITHTAPDVQLHIQDYIDELNVNAIPLTQYDIILGMSWLEKYDATVAHTSRTVSLTYEGSNIKLQQPLSASAANDAKVHPTNDVITADINTPLVKDDQQLIAREEAHEVGTPHYNNIIINILATITLLLFLFVVHTVYTYIKQSLLPRADMVFGETFKSSLTAMTTLITYIPTSISYPIPDLSNTFTIISLLFYLCPYLLSSSSKQSADHQISGAHIVNKQHEHTQQKPKKGRPR
jgi:hypothetical protein